MVIFIRWNHSKARIARESTSLWHVQNTQDHSHTPRYTRDLISYPLYFFRLIAAGGRKCASGSAPRLPATAAAAPTGPGMPQTHHLTGPGPPGAAREPLGAPNGRHQSHPCQAHPVATFEGLQKIDESRAPRGRRGCRWLRQRPGQWPRCRWWLRRRRRRYRRRWQYLRGAYRALSAP